MRRRLTLLAVALLCALGGAHSASAQSTSTLRIAIPGEDGSLTPYTFESGYALMSLVYDTLTWRDASGVARPWLARSIKRDPANRFVDVRLRSGVRWHDGRPLTAGDVAFTYAFMARRRNPRFTPQLQDIQDVKAIGELSVRFTLRRASLGFSDQPLADVPILPRHLWEGLAQGRLAPAGLPVGTGPYRLVSHERGASYRLQANSRYFRGAPTVRRIDVPIIGSEDGLFTALRRGQIDAAPVTVPPGRSPRSPPGVRFSDEISYSGTMLLFNVRRPPFSRGPARRAVARALDLKAITGNAAGVDGASVPADRGVLHPRSRWAGAGVLHRFDPDAARLAFSEQGIGAFRVAAPRNDPVRLAAGERVVRALVAAGASARLVTLAPAELDRALGRGGSPATFDAAIVGIPALASDDPAYLRAVFGDLSGAPLNDGGYRSSAFDDLASRAASATTDRRRRDLVNQQLRLLARELPAVPLLFGGGTFAYRPVAYDRWVSIRGSGILDKRSFLSGEVVPGRQAPASAAPRDLLDRSPDENFSLLPLIIGVLVLLIAGAGWWVRRTRR